MRILLPSSHSETSKALAAVFLLVFASVVFAQQPDTGFGQNGSVSVAVPYLGGGDPSAQQSESGIKSFYLTNENKILGLGRLAVGHAKGPGLNLVLFGKFNYDGTPDTTFDGDGIKFPVGNVQIFDAVQQPDTKILVAGYFTDAQNTSVAKGWYIARLDTDGSLDQSFGTGGAITRTFSGIRDIAQNIALQSDGKVLVSGISQITTGLTLSVVLRLNSNGTFDGSFGPYGKAFIDFYDGGSLAGELAVQSDDSIMLGGDTSAFVSGSDLLAARLTPNGLMDQSFGNGGLVYVDFGYSETFADLKLRGDGKIVLCGNRLAGNISSQILTQLQPDGSLDVNFGDSGRVKNDLSFEGERTMEMTLRPDGTIIIAAVASQVVPNTAISVTTKYFPLIIKEIDVRGRTIGTNFTRLTSQGQTVFDVALTKISVRDIDLLPDGKVLLAGTRFSPSFSVPHMALFRFLSISAQPSASASYDFDNNGRDDISIIREDTNGVLSWWSSNGFAGNFETQFGMTGDIPAPADYNGDLTAEVAVFRPSTGEWITSLFNHTTCTLPVCFEKVKWGLADDIPAPGDFDGDGKTDRTVFRPSDGVWYVLKSSGGSLIGKFGQNGDKPVTGDFDGDGKSDLAVIRNQNGLMVWYIYQSATGNYAIVQFGLASDMAVVGDYNGDGRSEIAVWRPSTGDWYQLVNYSSVVIRNYGSNGDIPIPADYDNDDKSDIAVFRPSTSSHRIILSGTDTEYVALFGLSTDFPTVSAYVRGFE